MPILKEKTFEHFIKICFLFFYKIVNLRRSSKQFFHCWNILGQQRCLVAQKYIKVQRGSSTKKNCDFCMLDNTISYLLIHKFNCKRKFEICNRNIHSNDLRDFLTNSIYYRYWILSSKVFSKNFAKSASVYIQQSNCTYLMQNVRFQTMTIQINIYAAYKI